MFQTIIKFIFQNNDDVTLPRRLPLRDVRNGERIFKKPEIVYENDWVIAVVYNRDMVTYMIIIDVGHL